MHRNVTPGVAIGAADVIGVWQSDDGGSLSMWPDGRFVGTDLRGVLLPNFPQHLPAGVDQSSTGLSAAGSWSLEPPLGQSDQPKTYLKLKFDAVNGEPVAVGGGLRAEREGEKTVLVEYDGDPDREARYIFRRKSTEPPASGEPR
jgi:hypothetical protein